jgi:hypothetical protein
MDILLNRKEKKKLTLIAMNRLFYRSLIFVILMSVDITEMRMRLHNENWYLFMLIKPHIYSHSCHSKDDEQW